MKQQKLKITDLQINSFVTSYNSISTLKAGFEGARVPSVPANGCDTKRAAVCFTDPPHCDTSNGGPSGNDTNGDR